MPLHAEARALLDLLAELGMPALDAQDPPAARATRKQYAAPVIEGCHEIRDLTAGDVPVRLYQPEPGDATPGLLVWLHGGGWVIGDLDSHDNVCRSLANRSGHAVLAVEYRLAPEHPFPCALGDCTEALQWAHAHAGELGVDPDRIAIGGDSAGGNLAAVIAHSPPVPIVHQTLVYPVTDCRADTPSYAENGDGGFLTADAMRWFIGHYLCGDDGSADDPRVSPLLAPDAAIAQSPPSLVITAGYDPLRDEGIRYAERLAAAGVAVSHVHYSGQLHGFLSFPHMMVDSRTALALVAEAVSSAFAS